MYWMSYPLIELPFQHPSIFPYVITVALLLTCYYERSCEPGSIFSSLLALSKLTPTLPLEFILLPGPTFRSAAYKIYWYLPAFLSVIKTRLIASFAADKFMIKLLRALGAETFERDPTEGLPSGYFAMDNSLWGMRSFTTSRELLLCSVEESSTYHDPMNSYEATVNRMASEACSRDVLGAPYAVPPYSCFPRRRYSGPDSLLSFAAISTYYLDAMDCYFYFLFQRDCVCASGRLVLLGPEYGSVRQYPSEVCTRHYSGPLQRVAVRITVASAPSTRDFRVIAPIEDVSRSIRTVLSVCLPDVALAPALHQGSRKDKLNASRAN
ncbi:hypothetical protein Tco_0213917 [Tanacetum coccineum]